MIEILEIGLFVKKEIITQWFGIDQLSLTCH